MSETLTTEQRRTLPARQALASKFPSLEAKRAFYRQIGERGNTRRFVLSGDDAAALAEAYSLLSRIADKLPNRADDAPGEGGER